MMGEQEGERKAAILAADHAQHLSQQTYLRVTVAQLWENLPLLVLSGFVFGLLCTPVILLLFLSQFAPALAVGVVIIAPAWAGLLALAAKIGRGVWTSIGVFFRLLPRLWVRSTGLGVLFSVPALLGLLTLPILAHPEARLVVWVGLVADAFGELLIAALCMYAFPLLVLYNVGVGTALSSALVLASRNIGNTLGLLGMGVLFLLAAVYLSPGLLFVLPAVWALLVVNNCAMLVDKELATQQAIGRT